jgi:5-methyltetrahydrofolate--homocysteine methyltransferase
MISTEMPDISVYTRTKKPVNGQARKTGKEGASILWNYALEDDQLNGHQFIRKFRIEEHKIDFVCKRLKLAIDVTQNRDTVAYQSEKEKHSFLERRGYKVLKYTNSEIISKIDDVVSDIFYVAESLDESYKNSMDRINL